ncbi:hypothetical protein, partial [Vibrio harveyi]|uniref:hypothetical protein n=1 Tax=Vibrio harveyi TaxID=669 RepID=UPI000AEE8E27
RTDDIEFSGDITRLTFLDGQNVNKVNVEFHFNNLSSESAFYGRDTIEYMLKFSRNPDLKGGYLVNLLGVGYSVEGGCKHLNNIENIYGLRCHRRRN